MEFNMHWAIYKRMTRHFQQLIRSEDQANLPYEKTLNVLLTVCDTGLRKGRGDCRTRI